jgi:hypothetical protein
MNLYSKLLLLVLMLAQPSHAVVIPGPEQYLAAAKKFEQMKLDTNQRQTMPRITDENVADVLKVLSDERVLTARYYGVKDLGLLLDVCGKANEVNMSYALFDLKSQMSPNAQPIEAAAKVKSVMEKNVVNFQDEISVVLPFLIKCTATQTPLLNQFMESLRPEEFTDVRRKGALQARDGMLNIYYGTLTSVADLRIKEANRLRMLAVLAETSSVFAKSLPNDRRKSISDLVNSVLRVGPDLFRSYLLKIQDSMSESICNAMCKL